MTLLQFVWGLGLSAMFPLTSSNTLSRAWTHSWAQARQLVPGAVCWIAIPCATWVYMFLACKQLQELLSTLGFVPQCSLCKLFSLGVEEVLTEVGSELLDLGSGSVEYFLLASVKNRHGQSMSQKKTKFLVWSVLVVSSILLRRLHTWARIFPWCHMQIPLLQCVCAHAGNTTYLSVASANRLARRIAYLSLASQCWYEFGIRLVSAHCQNGDDNTQAKGQGISC